MKTILVPCDFSKTSIHAFRVALDIAGKSAGTVHLLNVVELPVLHDSVLMPVLNFEEAFLKEMREKAEAEFENVVRKYNTKNAKVEKVVQFGRVSGMIEEYISDHSIDLVVLGSHGASGLRELLIGSNAEKIVRRSSAPVLVVKEYSKSDIKNIVFPNTLETEHQEDLLLHVKDLQAFFNAKLHLVWINTPLNFTSDSVTHARLQDFAKRYMLKNYTVNVFNHPNEEDGILEFNKFIGGDLIAMGTHSRRGIAHLVNGSLAEDVVNHTTGMVWTYTLKNEPVLEG